MPADHCARCREFLTVRQPGNTNSKLEILSKVVGNFARSFDRRISLKRFVNDGDSTMNSNYWYLSAKLLLVQSIYSNLANRPVAYTVNLLTNLYIPTMNVKIKFSTVGKCFRATFHL